MSKINDFIAGFGEHHTRLLSDLDDAQRSALVDALALAMFIDEEVVQAEIDMFNEIVAQLPTFCDMDPNERRSLLDASLDKMRNLPSHETALQLVHSVADQLPLAPMREIIFAMAVAITLADRVVVDLETNALGEFVSAFGLEFPRAFEIIAETRSVLGVAG